MTIEETKRNVRIILKPRPDFNISLIYNKAFFNELFGLNVSVHSAGNLTKIDDQYEENNNVIQQIDDESDKQSDETSVDEATQETNNLDESNDSNEPKPGEQKGGFFKQIQQYINKFISTANEDVMYNVASSKMSTSLKDTTENKEVVVLFPKHRFQVLPFRRFLYNIRSEPSIFYFKNTGLDYIQIEYFLKDMISQIHYLTKMGVCVNKFKKESVFVINEHFVLLDVENIEMKQSKGQVKKMYDNFYAFLMTILNVNDIIDLEPMKYTSVYKTLVRLKQEQILEFV
jgi:hypothetical protein